MQNTARLYDPVRRYLTTAATPVCMKILKLWEECQYRELVSLKVRPQDYQTAGAYLTDAQAVAFFKKNADIEAGIDTRKAAWEGWLQGNAQCLVTNKKLRAWCDGASPDHFMLRIQEFILDVKRQVTWWFGGNFSDPDAGFPACFTPKFGPGSTVSCRGRTATVADKMSISPHCTTRLIDLLKHHPMFEETAWARALLDRRLLGYEDGSLSGFVPCDFSEWTSVPKNALTQRGIGMGVDVSLSYQLATGAWMKSCFRNRGWDLRIQQPIHRELAREGSITRNWSTIDLKNASNTVSIELVNRCVPPLLKEWLNILRETHVRKDGDLFRCELFSSMGNGFTFELESVLFMSVCQVVLRRLGLPHKGGTDVFVYGDDLIVPTSAATEVIAALQLCGFEINESKTFVDGPFRESCGGDFWCGEPVRAHELEKFPTTPAEHMALANGLRRAGAVYRDDFLHRDHFRNAWASVLDCLPSAIRECRGPKDLGDLVIHDPDTTRWITRWKHGIRSLRTWSPVTVPRGQRSGGSVLEWDNFYPLVKFATVLSGRGDSPMTGGRDTDIGLVPRSPFAAGYRHKWVPFS